MTAITETRHLIIGRSEAMSQVRILQVDISGNNVELIVIGRTRRGIYQPRHDNIVVPAKWLRDAVRRKKESKFTGGSIRSGKKRALVVRPSESPDEVFLWIFIPRGTDKGWHIVVPKAELLDAL